ncbi:MAG: class I SAM-dependent RNA methyltransferase [Thermocrinis sp.]|nr:class I SAM-dependent RNA methyltransferase [Thermocrinis sp.]
MELVVQRLVYGGYGVGEVKGRKFLVRYAAPKELVEVDVLRETRIYTEAVVKKVKIEGEGRRLAPCRYYMQCGGCQLQHIEYGHQLKAKEEILLDAFERIGKIKLGSVSGILASKEEFGYRTRVQFKVKDGQLGFFAWKSKDLVPVDECLLAHPKINQLIPSLKEIVKIVSGLQEIHVLYSPYEDEYLLKLVGKDALSGQKLKDIKEKFLPKEVVNVGSYVLSDGKPVKTSSVGRDFTYFRSGKFLLRVSSDSFFQINYTLYEDYPKLVADGERVKRVLELHCGVGLFSFWLSEKCDVLFGSDANLSAVKDAIYNAKLNQISKTAFAHEKAIHTLRSHMGEVIDLLVLDPPKEGLSKLDKAFISQNKPERIIYKSSEPTTLARDLHTLTTLGYKIESVYLVDELPQTFHISAVVKLRLLEALG